MKAARIARIPNVCSPCWWVWPVHPVRKTMASELSVKVEVPVRSSSPQKGSERARDLSFC